MNYIWDIAIQAHKEGISKSDLFWEQGKDVSPYYEQSFSSINQINIENTNIEINALCRFANLFSRYLHDGFVQNPEFKMYFYDLVIHFLSEIDLGKGICKESIYLSELENDIKAGVYGEDISNNYKTIKDSYNLLPLVIKQIRIGSSLKIFRESIMRVYKDALVYQIKEEPNKVLVYLGKKKTSEENSKYDFLEKMFCPIEYEVRVFWENHFGVLGVDVTLVLDGIELY